MTHRNQPPTPLTPAIPVPPELVDHPRYKVLKPLGKGGMGAVFLAEHKAMGRTVALKTVNPALLAGHESALPRFQQEVRAAAALNHPNIVQAYDADHAGDTHFLVMEYVDGMDKLFRHLTNTPEPLETLRPEVPKELVAIVTRMMEKEPAKRYEKPIEVVTALAPQIPSAIATSPFGPGGQFSANAPPIWVRRVS